MPIINHKVLENIAYGVFKAAGIPDEEAEIISDHIVTANLLGHDSHGVWYISRYGQQALEKYVPWQNHDVIRENPLFQLFNGNGAHGIVALTKATSIAIDKAHNSAIGMAGVKNVTHMGRLGAYPTHIAEQGMIGMVWTNTGGLAVSPFGSAERKLRLAPVAFSVPRRNKPPFTLDMTFSVVAGGKIEQKIARNETIPDGWLVNRNGNYENEGSAYQNQNASILPLGGLQFGHKGQGLSMIMEMIVGPLTQAGCPDGNEKGGGALITAINISEFTDIETYLDEVEEFADYVRSAEKLPETKDIYAPGEMEEAVKTHRNKTGIPIPDVTWEEIVEIATRLKVSIPSI